MKFNNIDDLKKAVLEIRNKTPKGKRTHFPVLFKKACIDYHYAKKVELTRIRDIVGVTNSTVYNWRDQYNDGLYSMEGAYAVSRKSKSLNGHILSALNQKVEELTEQIKVVEAATKLGLEVSIKES